MQPKWAWLSCPLLGVLHVWLAGVSSCAAFNRIDNEHLGAEETMPDAGIALDDGATTMVGGSGLQDGPWSRQVLGECGIRCAG